MNQIFRYIIFTAFTILSCFAYPNRHSFESSLRTNAIDRNWSDSDGVLRHRSPSGIGKGWHSADGDGNYRKIESYLHSLSNCPTTQFLRGRDIEKQTSCSRQSLPYNVSKEEYMEYDLPMVYDPRKIPTEVELCPSIVEVSDQGACNSCWAVVAADVMTNRLCKTTSGINKTRYSAVDLLTCCKSCQDPFAKGKFCPQGGMQEKAWIFWNTTGLTSGGFYDSNKDETCKSYPIPRCNHVQSTFLPHIPHCNGTSDPDNLKCNMRCDSNTVEFKRHRGTECYTIPRKCDGEERALKIEIHKNGPVHADMLLYNSFSETCLGSEEELCSNTNEAGTPVSHSIRIIGWGIDYWIVANSWGKHWGQMKGFFHLHMNFVGGTTVIAGMPVL